MTLAKRLLLAAYLFSHIALWPTVSTAAATGAVALATASENGKITRLNFRANELVVGDSLFKLSSQVVVYDTRGSRTATNSLENGLRIAFNLVRDPTGASLISAIWILPSK